MSRLKIIREQQNLTQEELSDKSGISVRTIQRIEAGTVPKGYTLKILAKTLGIQEKELQGKEPQKEAGIAIDKKSTVKKESVLPSYSLIKLINLSSLPFVIVPPFNILLPLILMYATKQKNLITKQIISVQIMWTVLAPIIFMLIIFTKPGNKITLITMILLVLSNVYIILRNAAAIDKQRELHYKLNFNMI